MFEDLLLVFTILYVLQIGMFAVGAHKAQYSTQTSWRPMVSIVIAARNEEHTIGPCLESVARLTYPRALLECIVVNDRSTDATSEIVQRFSAKHDFIRLLNATEDPAHTLKGKPNAVAQGIDAARGEILLFTDADCIVPPGWVEETVKYYDKPDVGLVAGFTSLRYRNLFEAIQALDWFVLFSIAAATIRLKFPVTAVGNNLSVRREAYNAVGGYRKIPFSITEDYALFHAITARTRYVAKFPVDAATLVESLPCDSVAALFKQKKRWFIGGADMDMKSISLFATGYVFKALLVINLFTAGFLAVLVPFVAKLATDFLLAKPALSRFGKLRLILYLIPFEVYYIAYVLLFPPLVLVSRNVSWKEREFTK